jgi:hypothetical protein
VRFVGVHIAPGIELSPGFACFCSDRREQFWHTCGVDRNDDG